MTNEAKTDEYGHQKSGGVLKPLRSKCIVISSPVCQGGRGSVLATWDTAETGRMEVFYDEIRIPR